MTNLKKKTIAAAISAAFAAAMTGATVSADENPFTSEADGYDLFATSHEGADGEGEGQCGEGGGDKDEGQCGEGQCGEGEGDKDEGQDEDA